MEMEKILMGGIGAMIGLAAVAGVAQAYTPRLDHVCPICGARFATYEELCQHFTAEHPTEPEPTPAPVPARFKSAQILTRSIKPYIGMRQYGGNLELAYLLAGDPLIDFYSNIRYYTWYLFGGLGIGEENIVRLNNTCRLWLLPGPKSPPLKIRIEATGDWKLFIDYMRSLEDYITYAERSGNGNATETIYFPSTGPGYYFLRLVLDEKTYVLGDMIYVGVGSEYYGFLPAERDTDDMLHNAWLEYYSQALEALCTAPPYAGTSNPIPSAYFEDWRLAAPVLGYSWVIKGSALSPEGWQCEFTGEGLEARYQDYVDMENDIHNWMKGQLEAIVDNFEAF